MIQNELVSSQQHFQVMFYREVKYNFKGATSRLFISLGILLQT